ncbi:YdeI/OmpD-associated family protein [Aestuariivivens insulae]|uniref:YdeI/OmpD-associated family protein n=1 Tax=Aestuariivivens insulae TaxID=1621988 RepID=UPI001F56CCAE|nr:YdeI family protein [Aestuariivivens insulae]
MNPKVVDRFLSRAKKWNEEMTLLRKICLDCGLTEDFKWMHPCYTFQGKNIVLIHGFKAYCALLFHKGALLKDTENMLVQQTENVQAARQIRFTSIEEIKALESTIKAYIFEAVEVERAGLEVKMKTTQEYDVPEELLLKFEEIPDLKNAFETLTPGRQRGYLLYFSGAKQSKTRASRIEKCIDKILKGKGLNDA